MDWNLFNSECEQTIPALYRAAIGMYTGPFYDNESVNCCELLTAIVKEAQNPERSASQRKLMDAVAVSLLFNTTSEPEAKNKLKTLMNEKWEIFIDTLHPN